METNIENNTENLKKKRTKKEYNLKLFQEPNRIEIGIDEAGAGSFFGSLFIAGVILPDNIEELMKGDGKVIIRDSKKMSIKQREYSRKFIEQYALDWYVIEKKNREIDEINILQARLKGFHEVIDNMKIRPDKILMDGDKFNIYYDREGNIIEHECIIEGDNTYLSIAAASILAKTHHDEHIAKLIEENPDYKKYDIHNNMGYGTSRHIQAIKDFGVTPYHRLSFGICRSFSNGRFTEKEKKIKDEILKSDISLFSDEN